MTAKVSQYFGLTKRFKRLKFTVSWFQCFLVEMIYALCRIQSNSITMQQGNHTAIKKSLLHPNRFLLNWPALARQLGHIMIPHIK